MPPKRARNTPIRNPITNYYSIKAPKPAEDATAPTVARMMQTPPLTDATDAVVDREPHRAVGDEGTGSRNKISPRFKAAVLKYRELAVPEESYQDDDPLMQKLKLFISLGNVLLDDVPGREARASETYQFRHDPNLAQNIAARMSEDVKNAYRSGDIRVGGKVFDLTGVSETDALAGVYLIIVRRGEEGYGWYGGMTTRALRTRFQEHQFGTNRPDDAHPLYKDLGRIGLDTANNRGEIEDLMSRHGVTRSEKCTQYNPFYSVTPKPRTRKTPSSQVQTYSPERRAKLAEQLRSLSQDPAMQAKKRNLTQVTTMVDLLGGVQLPVSKDRRFQIAAHQCKSIRFSFLTEWGSPPTHVPLRLYVDDQDTKKEPLWPGCRVKIGITVDGDEKYYKRDTQLMRDAVRYWEDRWDGGIENYKKE
ncbi:hypothetical protein HK104_000001 [Borealophlyctis nickersoniae]|nr:hypothetical protein HK104_000001 [Borealophlyctis nickersoniae]